MNTANILARDVSLIVFSRDRGQFLNRLAGVLNNLDFGGTLIIADASDEAVYQQTNAMLCNLHLGYEVIHFNEIRTPEQSISSNINNSIIRASTQVKTAYTMLTCDDDIPCPRTLDHFAKFLSSEHNYSGVVGEHLWLNLDSDGTPTPAFRHKNLYQRFIRKQLRFNDKAQQSLHVYMGDATQESGYLRAINFFKQPFTVMFAVIKSNTLKYLVAENHEKICVPHFSAEYNWFFNIVNCGRIKKINMPHVFRQQHISNLSSKDGNHPYPHFIESLISETWFLDVNHFLDNISMGLQRVDGSSEEESKRQAMEILKEIILLRVGATGKRSVAQRLILLLKEFKYLLHFTSSGAVLNAAVNEMKKFPVKI